MRRLACLAVLVLAACRTRPLTMEPRAEPAAVVVAAPSAPAAPPAVPRPAVVAGSASVMIQTMGNQRGPRGYMRYEGDVVAIDGVPFRARRKTFRVTAGAHVITVAWRNHRVPEWAGVAYDGMTSVLFHGEGVSDATIEASANRFYEVIWPSDDEPGGPLGFRDVTVRR
jgi:hypothetical protein